MPHWWSSIRSESDSASIANFDAAYAPSAGEATRPPTELMLTTRPRALRISGRNAWVTATWPTTFTSSCRRSASIGMISSGAGSAIPALLTSPRRPPSPTASVTRSAAPSIVGASVTSRITGVTAPELSAATLSPSASRRTPANTSKPRDTRSSAVARPIPVDAPVTMTAARLGDVLSPFESVIESTILWLDQAAPDRVADQLDAVAHAELAHRVRAVTLDRLLGEVEDLGDLAVGVRLRDQLHDLLLARSELVGLLRVTVEDILDQRSLRVRSQERL